MISSPLALPVPTLPTPPAAAANPAPSAPDTAEQRQGGFARLLDQAREEPADPAAAAQGGDAAAEKTARGRNLRAGPARPTAPRADAPAEFLPAQRELAVDATAAVGVEETPADPAAAPPAASPDTAVLLASLAALARPQPAPAGAPGTTAGGGDEGQAQPRQAGRTLVRLSQDGAAQAAQATVQAPAAGASAAERSAASAARLTTEPPAGAEAGAGGRSFAAELQATLASPVLAQPTATLAATPGQSSAATPAAQGHLAASPGSPAFAPELGATLATFVRQGVHHARLELNPADMGPLTVQIQLDGQAAQVHLAAQNADTRQALEQAMPTLAGSLREAGLTLSGGGVFEQPRQPQPEASAGDRGRDAGTDGERDDQPAGQAPVAPLRRRGVVDLVA